MQDSRLIQMREMAKECQTLAAEMMDESISNPHDMLNVARAEKFAAALAQAVTAAYSETVEKCANRGGFSSVCELPKGHDGKHRQRATQWDEESQRVFAKAMSAGRFGRLD